MTNLSTFDAVLKECYRDVLIEQLNIRPFWYVEMTPEQLAAQEARRLALDEALWNVGASGEDARAIGDAYWYGKYGGEPD